MTEVNRVEQNSEEPTYKVLTGACAYDPSGGSMPTTDVSTTVEVNDVVKHVKRKRKEIGPIVLTVQGDIRDDNGVLLLDVPASMQAYPRSARGLIFREYPGLSELIFKQKCRKLGDWGRVEMDFDGSKKVFYFVISRVTMKEKDPDEFSYFRALDQVVVDMSERNVTEVAMLPPPMINAVGFRNRQVWCDLLATAFARRRILVRIYCLPA